MGISVPEAIDELRVASEMITERGPLSCERSFHDRELRRWTLQRRTKQYHSIQSEVPAATLRNEEAHLIRSYVPGTKKHRAFAY